MIQVQQGGTLSYWV